MIFVIHIGILILINARYQSNVLMICGMWLIIMTMIIMMVMNMMSMSMTIMMIIMIAMIIIMQLVSTCDKRPLLVKVLGDTIQPGQVDYSKPKACHIIVIKRYNKIQIKDNCHQKISLLSTLTCRIWFLTLSTTDYHKKLGVPQIKSVIIIILKIIIITWSWWWPT